ncbi:MAG: sugar phosphate isomerase/epimerase [Deltaproteobacteria bacterium]|nr:sugar phosphate isomerase/epimerase [Deltaproteobacteria bacterium]
MDWTIHATVPCQMLGNPETVRLLAGTGVGPEIYLSGASLDSLSPGRAESLAETVRAAGVKSVTFHAPFEDICPGARDEEARRVASRRLRQAIELAPLFHPRGIVVHGGYSGWIYDFDPLKWLEPARRTLGEAMESAEKTGVDLFLENVFDEVPDHMLRLAEAIGSKRLGFCLDPGHAALFSGIPVHKWVEAFGPELRELHVHDNRGTRDDHLPVGEGSVNFGGILHAALDAGAFPILTLEPHRIEHFHRGLAALRVLLAGLPPGTARRP